MKKTQEKRVGTLPALLVAVLSFGGFVGAATIVSHNASSLTPVSLAKDGEDGGGGSGGGGSNSDKQSESDKKAQESAKKAKERSQEATKKQNEQANEAAKRANERSGKTELSNTGKDVGDDNGIDDTAGVENESDLNEDHGNGSEEGMFKDRTKTLTELDKELAKAQEDILKQQAEGVDVTAALARLAEAKAKIGTVGGAFESNDLAAAKTLSQEVKKLTHLASHDDLHSTKEVAEKASQVSKRIAQAYGKVTLLENVGGDGSAFRASLVSFEADLAALKTTVAAGGFDAAAVSTSLEALERKVKAVKNSVEGAIYALGGTDRQFGDDLENESDDMVEHLNDVANIEDDNIGQVIRGIAKDHQIATKKTSEAVSSVDQRNLILQTLFGASGSDLRTLEQEIAADKNRVQILTKAADSITDPDVKTMLLNQVVVLKEQTAKLETFVSGQDARLSVFGWISHFFQR